MNLSHAFAQDSFVLIAVFFLLFSMSFVSWYLIFWKSLKLRRENLAFQKFHSTHAQIKDWPAHRDFQNVEGGVSFLLNEVKKLESILPKYSTHEAKKEILTMHLSQELESIRVNLDKGLTVLASIGSSAPFIGLFGTVWGIYGALASIAAQGNAGISVVAGPMGEALIATAIGLFAAIPAVLAYNSFVRLNRLLIQNLKHVAEQMVVYLSNTTQKH